MDSADQLGSSTDRRASQDTLSYLGVVIGVAGILTIVTGLDVALPALDVPETVFVLVIVWFVWLGIVMLRGHQQARSPSVSRGNLKW